MGWEWKEIKDANRHEKHMRVVKSDDEGDGSEIGVNGGWNNEQQGMMNEMGENEF